MSTFHQLREGLNEAWDTLLEGWQRLYRRAAGAITRFTPGGKDNKDNLGHEVAARSTGWSVLAAEVYDDDDKVVVRLETPGMEKDDFDIQVTDNYLIVRGEKLIERERSESRYHITECAYGRFERAIPLPVEIESDMANASYKKGVLRVELPKTKNSQRKKINIQVN